jgi:hypothetical protein
MNTLPVTNQDTHGRYTNEPAQYGVYDKPSDRRLAPWIVLGSIILGVFLNRKISDIPQFV